MMEDAGSTGRGPEELGPLVIDEAELTAQALAADPLRPVDADAVPFDVFGGRSAGLLPEWYMPPVTARRGRRGGRARMIVVLAVVGAFLVIEAAGLCSTYGQLPFH